MELNNCEVNGRTCKCAAGITRKTQQSNNYANVTSPQDQPDEIDRYNDWHWRSKPLRKQEENSQSNPEQKKDYNSQQAQDQPDEIDRYNDWHWRSKPLRKPEENYQSNPEREKDFNSNPQQDQPEEFNCARFRSQPLQTYENHSQRQDDQNFAFQRYICCPPPLENKDPNYWQAQDAGAAQSQLKCEDPKTGGKSAPNEDAKCIRPLCLDD